MKKLIVSLVAALSLLFGGIAIGDSLNGSYNGNPIVKVLAGGKTLTDEVPAQIIDGKTMIPLTMLRSLGFNVTWNQADYSVTVQKPLTDADIAQISRSVGIVYVFKDGKQLGQGSAFVIDSSVGKVLVTNCHVGCIGDELHVTLDGKSYVLKGSLFANETTDVFGVRIDTDVPGLKMSTQEPTKSEVVTAIGYPKSRYAVTKGDYTTNIYHNGNVKYFAFDAKIDHGSSGGVLLGQDGIVIGVTSSGYDGNPNNVVINEAIPMQYVQNELERLK